MASEKKATIHGDSRTHFYKLWMNMKSRCDYRKNNRYHCYGSRGIKYCDRWTQYLNFKEDMYEGYIEHFSLNGKRNTSLDRIDNNGGYCKENCRWATINQQMRNKKNTRLIEYNGKKMILADWAMLFNIRLGTLKQRFYVYKWSLDKCFNF